MNDFTSTREQIRRLAAGDSLPRDPQFERSLAEAGVDYELRGDRLSLSEPLELLDHDSIVHGLSAEASALLSHLEIFWTIDSTNTWMLKSEKRDDWHGLICLAEQQSAGKGRRGRGWISPFGKNIYMSVGWGMPKNISGLSGLSLMVGIQVVGALRDMGLQDVWLKWPNDILMGSGKLAGILVELTAPSRGRVGIVTGIGVNLQLGPEDVAGIDQPWSAIRQQREISRNALVASILSNLLPALSRFELDGFAGYQRDWNAYDVFRDRAVVVHIGENRVSGVNKGIDLQGNLLIETENGLETFSAGEVSLREG